jgi:hypothetical protein
MTSTRDCLRKFLHIKTKIWIATVNYQRISKDFQFPQILQK